MMREVSMDPDKLRELSLLSSRIARTLRRNACHKELTDVPQRPDFFYEQGEFGDYPIFAYPGRMCNQYAAGFCTPCGYSGIPRSERIPIEDFYCAQVNQTQYIIDHFDEIIAGKQTGYLDKHNVHKRFPDGPVYKLQLAGESSFFRDAEIPRENRMKILQLFDRFAVDNRINLHIMLETRPEHMLAVSGSGELGEYRDLGFIKNFTLVVNMGFEAYDEVSRNVLFNKNMALADLEESIRVAKDFDLDPSLFVFIGPHSMSEMEVVEDTRKTLAYMQRLDVPPSLMSPNLQPYTINHLLYVHGRYNLVDPRTIVKIVELCRDLRLNRIHPSLDVDWFIGGLEAEPAPWLTVFNNQKRISCDVCNETIYNALYRLKKDYGIERFFDSIKPIHDCACRATYEKHYDAGLSMPLLDRIEENLRFAEEMADEYIGFMRDTMK